MVRPGVVGWQGAGTTRSQATDAHLGGGRARPGGAGRPEPCRSAPRQRPPPRTPPGGHRVEVVPAVPWTALGVRRAPAPLTLQACLLPFPSLLPQALSSRTSEPALRLFPMRQVLHHLLPSLIREAFVSLTQAPPFHLTRFSELKFHHPFHENVLRMLCPSARGHGHCQHPCPCFFVSMPPSEPGTRVSLSSP